MKSDLAYFEQDKFPINESWVSNLNFWKFEIEFFYQRDQKEYNHIFLLFSLSTELNLNVKNFFMVEVAQYRSLKPLVMSHMVINIFPF